MDKFSSKKKYQEEVQVGPTSEEEALKNPLTELLWIKEEVGPTSKSKVTSGEFERTIVLSIECRRFGSISRSIIRTRSLGSIVRRDGYKC
jgi:hypothetical protein